MFGVEVGVPVAEQAVAAEVAVFEPLFEPDVADAEVRLDLDQLGGLGIVVVVHPADLFREDQDAAVGVDDLGLEVGVHQVGAAGDRPVVGQEDDVGVLDVGDHRVGERLGPGGLVGGDGDLAEEDLELGHRALGDRLVGDGEGRGVGRVAVDARLDVGPGLHDRQVQEDLARPLPLARDLLAVHVDDAEVVRLHVPLRDPGRRAEDPVLAQAVRDVAVVRRGEPLGVDPPADLAHLLAELPLAHQAVGHVRVLRGFRRVVRLEVEMVDQAGAVGVHRRLVGAERVGRLGPLAQPDDRSRARAEVIEGDDLLAPLRRVAREGLAWQRQGDHEPGRLQARVDPRERDPADDLGDPHRATPF